MIFFMVMHSYIFILWHVHFFEKFIIIIVIVIIIENNNDIFLIFFIFSLFMYGCVYAIFLLLLSTSTV